MDYYTRRAEANKRVDELYAKGVELNKIIFVLDKEMGFSEKFVQKRISLIEKINRD